MRVRFSRQADADLREIRAYYEQGGPAAARRVRDAILASINLLRIRPAIGIHTVGEPGLRSKLVVGYPYRIHFRIRDGALEILHIRHTARRPRQGMEE